MLPIFKTLNFGPKPLEMAVTRSALLLICTLLLSCVQVLAAEYLTLSVTAGVNGVSVIQCWQLESSFAQTFGNSTDFFLTTQLGNLANASYTIFPAGTNYGTHAAPNVQLVLSLLLTELDQLIKFL